MRENASSSQPHSASEVGEKARGERVARALHGAFCRGAPGDELLELAANKIWAWGHPFGGAYIYRLEGSNLSLKASAGPPAEISDLRVDSLASLSETPTLAATIRRHDLILGAVLARPLADSSFSQTDEADVAQVAHALAALL